MHRNADVAGNGARRLEMDDLPAVGELTGAVEVLGPERRRVDAQHPARDGRGALRVGHVKRGVGNGFVADGTGMDVGLVREVHQVVDDEAVVAFEVVERAALADPIGSIVPVEVRHAGRVGKGGIAGPDPDQAVLLDGGKSPHPGGRVDRLLRRHEGAAPGAVEAETVVAAHHRVALERAERERHQPVPTGVFQRRDRAILLAEQDDVALAYGALVEVTPDLVAPSRCIPGVQRIARFHDAPPRFPHRGVGGGEAQRVRRRRYGRNWPDRRPSGPFPSSAGRAARPGRSRVGHRRPSWPCARRCSRSERSRRRSRGSPTSAP